MRFVSRINTLPIYAKLILAFLLVIIPIYIISIAMNQSGTSIVQEKIYNSMENNVHFYLNSFETELNRLDNLKQDYIGNEYLLKLSTMADTMTEYEKMLNIQSLQNMMKLVKNSSIYVNEIKIYIPSMHRTIYSGDYGEDMPYKEVEALDNKNGSINSPLIFWNGKLLLGETFPSISIDKQYPEYAIEFELSTKQVKNALLNVMNEEQGGAVLVYQEQNIVIGNEKDNKVSKELVNLLNLPEFKEVQKGEGVIKNERKRLLITFERSKHLGLTLVTYVPREIELGSINKYRLWLWVLSVISVIVIVFFSFWIYRLIHRPLKSMVSAFKKVEKGDLGVSIKHEKKDEFHYLYFQFNQMVERLKLLIHEIYEQHILLQKAELKQLQSQINPHFLYNTYFQLYQMAQFHEMDNVAKLSKHLGDYMKYITRDGSDEATLEEEISHVYAYVEIQLMRFSDRIRAEMDSLPEFYKFVRVPRLFLQPVIENAFNHGLKKVVSDGVLKIKIYPCESIINICVEDNGNELTDNDLEDLDKSLASPGNWKETTGLINVHRRLQLKYGEEFGILVSRGQLGGLQVDIRIPVDKGGDYE